MNRTYYTTGLLLLLAPSALATADEKRTLNYRREQAQSRQQEQQAPAREMPAELAASKRQQVYDRREPQNRRQSRNQPERSDRRGGRNAPDGPGRESGGDRRLIAQARDAAQQKASELASGRGYREYYRVGFHQALKAALRHGGGNSWDYREGQRQAHRDRQVRREGRDIGEQAARDEAGNHAREVVVNQYSDLGREPVRQAYLGRIDTPRFEVEPYEAPSLEQVFLDNPLEGYRGWRHRHTQFYEGWRPNPYQLYQVDNYHGIYDASWREARQAFESFEREQGRRSWYRQLEKEQQRQFQRAFEEAYGDFLDDYYERYQRAGYNDGWGDGYAYGAFVNGEWQYRQGYFQGAMEALNQAAAESYQQTYAREYGRVYNETYDLWASQAHPEINRVNVLDENGDGVFQPGEWLRFELELTNYGGGSEVKRIEIAGSALGTSLTQRVNLPRRGRISVETQERVAIDSRAETHRDHTLHLNLGTLHQEIPLRVEWPVQIHRTELVTRDNLSGTARVAVTVANISTRSHAVDVVAASARKRLAQIEAGGQRTVEFEVTGHPLDMLAGYAGLDITLNEAGTQGDQLAYRLPEQATDLQNRDLLYLLLELARAPQGDPSRIAQAQELMLQRMHRDWQEAIRQRGNPYKRDYRQHSRETALGDLVVTYLEYRTSLRHGEVFTAMRPRLRELSQELPGTHPFLRKHYRRLLERLQ